MPGTSTGGSREVKHEIVMTAGQRLAANNALQSPDNAYSGQYGAETGGNLTNSSGGVRTPGYTSKEPTKFATDFNPPRFNGANSLIARSNTSGSDMIMKSETTDFDFQDNFY